MLNAIKTFSADETGAVTVDWVVLTAALVGLGLAVMGLVTGGIEDITNDMGGILCANIVGDGQGFNNTGGVTAVAINSDGTCP